ncbi:MFS transporter [Nonomuraea sp. PA05]|uniref:MFS transporter n=1 Tax=Nonomuraea sp. PA05 TaxID=2604466 RepID=UPI001651F714|nr:MFS transporter [Nonomuraea sp. PA05]
MPSVLRHRRYRYLFTAQLASTTASSMLHFVLPLLAFDITGSTTLAGVVTAVSLTAASLAGVLAGTIADRHDRALLVILALLAQALAFGALLALTLPGFGGGSAPGLAVLAGVVAAAGSLLVPAYAGILRAVVPRAEVRDAYTVNQGRIHVIAVVAPALAGVLYAAHTGWVLVAGLLLVLLAAVAVRGTRARARGVTRTARPAFVVDLRDGLLYVARRPPVWTAAVGGAVINLGINGALFTAVLALRSRGTASAEISLVESVSAAGAIAGVLAAGCLLRRLRVPTIVVWCGAAYAAAALVSGFVHTALVIGLLFGIATLLLPAWNSGVFGSIAADTPHELQGRVQSSIQLISAVLAPLPPMLSGLLLASVPYEAGMAAFSAVIVAGAAAQYAGREDRRRGETPAGATRTEKEG